ncbi:MAG: c-type cytochrome [Solirubrobacteraceae bacterium]
MRSRSVRGLALSACVAGAAGLLSGCGGLTDQGENVVNGKQLFVARCGACHVLNRAGTKGGTGPNLDNAFARARRDGFGESTFEGMVHRQIQQPARSPQVDPATGKSLPPMPADLVTGDDAEDVAAYVASAVAKPGEDSGALAQVGAAVAEGTAEASNGTLEIPADPGGSLAYTFADAEAPPGQLEIDSPNESSVDHNIALEGGGVNEVGPVVANGGVSTINVDVQAGEFQFFCTVTGHRAAGMEGTLTVE